MNELLGTVLLDGLEPLLHCSVPHQVPFSFRIGSRLAGVRQVELDVEVALHRGW